MNKSFMKASELKKDDVFTLTTRKNARKYVAAHIEVVTGDRWKYVIERGFAKEGQILVTGPCGTRFAGQMMLNPDQNIYMSRE